MSTLVKHCHLVDSLQQCTKHQLVLVCHLVDSLEQCAGKPREQPGCPFKKGNAPLRWGSAGVCLPDVHIFAIRPPVQCRHLEDSLGQAGTQSSPAQSTCTNSVCIPAATQGTTMTLSPLNLSAKRLSPSGWSYPPGLAPERTVPIQVRIGWSSHGIGTPPPMHGGGDGVPIDKIEAP